jgi:hypothetical protein
VYSLGCELHILRVHGCIATRWNGISIQPYCAPPTLHTKNSTFRTFEPTNP